MHPTNARIYTSHLRENWRLLCRMAPQALVCPVVKADAYGHGAVKVAQILRQEGAKIFGLTFIEEAKQFRQNKIDEDILLMGPLLPQDYAQAVALEVQPVVFEKEVIEALALEARSQGRKLKVHLKVDTGMGRLGCFIDEAADLAKMIVHHKHLELEGVCTHFASSDSPGPVTVEQQLDLFQLAIKHIQEQGFAPRLIHAANSGAIVNHSQTLLNMVRPGLALYGYPPSIKPLQACFRPVMELVSHVSFVKDVPAGTRLSYTSGYVTRKKTKVATVYLGYADGYRRSLSNKATLLIHEQLYRVSGIVCMDQLLVDLGPKSTVQKGTEVVLFGPRLGSPTAKDLAVWAKTTPYEILCGISARVPRLYLD